MESTALGETFTYQTSTHNFTVKWCALGDTSHPPLIFVHGTPWSSRVWAPYAVTLSRHYRVYLFDNPGFGESPLGLSLPEKQENGLISEASALDANLAQQSEVFAALYKNWQQDWREGRLAHVVAHDHAGIMTIRATLLHGCQYASLCQIDVVSIGPFGKPLFKLVDEQRSTFEQLPLSTFKGIIDGYINDAAHYQLSPETLNTLRSPWLRDGGQAGFVRQLRQANWRSTDGLEDRYGEIGQAMPVKIIWGAEDKWIPVETAERLGKALGAQEVTVIPGAGHLIMFDQGEALGVELALWLAKVTKH